MSFNFAATLTEKASAVPKQVFPESIAQEPTSALGNDPAVSSADQSSAQQNASEPIPGHSDAAPVSPLSPNELAAQAELWVEMSDFVISRSLAALGDKPVEENKATPDEKKTLKDALVRYFATLQAPPQIPAWLFLLGVVVLIYGPKTFTAVKEFRAKKAAEKAAKEAPKNIPVQQQPAEKSAVDGSPSAAGGSATDSIKFRTADRDFGKQGIGALDKSTKDDPYFKLIGKLNPVTEQENILRQRTGGKLCKLCQINYANKNRDTCSATCSGKYSARKNGKKKKSSSKKLKNASTPSA